MGIKTSEGGKAVFYKINAKEGCFQQGSGENKQKFEPGYTSMEGTVIGAKIEENEYDGVKSEAIRLILKDVVEGQPNMHVSLTIQSGDVPSAIAIKTLAKLNAADLSKPIAITPSFTPQGTKLGDIVFQNDYVSIGIKQGGHKIVEDLGTANNKLPDRPAVLGANNKPVMVAGKELKDSSAWAELLDKQLATLFSKLSPGQAQGEPGVDANEVAGGADAANRSSMRARA